MPDRLKLVPRFSAEPLPLTERIPAMCEASVEQSLSMVTSLNPHIGYEKAAALAEKRDGAGLAELFLPDYADFEGRDKAGK